MEQSSSTPTSATDVSSDGCDLCGGVCRIPVLSGHDRQIDLPGDFTFVRCATCGLLYQWPRPRWEQLKRHYEGDYPAYADREAVNPRNLGGLLARLGPLKQRRYVERFCRSGRLLDVGCGTGQFLAEMRRLGGWDLLGVEPTGNAAAYARGHLGLDIRNATFEEAGIAPGSQDVVTMWNVLEHLPSPTAALRRAREILRPDGILVFSVPNYEGISRRFFGRYWLGWDLPRHLFVIPQTALERMLRATGFRPIEQRCFQGTYAVLDNTLAYWTADWPAWLRPAGRLALRAYRTPLTRAALYPAQVLVERLGLATIVTWAARRDDDAAF